MLPTEPKLDDSSLFALFDPWGVTEASGPTIKENTGVSCGTGSTLKSGGTAVNMQLLC